VRDALEQFNNSSYSFCKRSFNYEDPNCPYSDTIMDAISDGDDFMDEITRFGNSFEFVVVHKKHLAQFLYV